MYRLARMLQLRRHQLPACAVAGSPRAYVHVRAHTSSTAHLMRSNPYARVASLLSHIHPLHLCTPQSRPLVVSSTSYSESLAADSPHAASQAPSPQSQRRSLSIDASSSSPGHAVTIGDVSILRPITPASRPDLVPINYGGKYVRTAARR